MANIKLKANYLNFVIKITLSVFLSNKIFYIYDPEILLIHTTNLNTFKRVLKEKPTELLNILIKHTKCLVKQNKKQIRCTFQIILL